VINQIEHLNFSHCKELDPAALQPLRLLFPNGHRLTVVGTELTKRSSKLLSFLDGVKMIHGDTAPSGPLRSATPAVSPTADERPKAPFPWLGEVAAARPRCFDLENFPAVAADAFASPGIQIMW
jgi:hypothetical protein